MWQSLPWPSTHFSNKRVSLFLELIHHLLEFLHLGFYVYWRAPSGMASAAAAAARKRSKLLWLCSMSITKIWSLPCRFEVRLRLADLDGERSFLCRSLRSDLWTTGLRSTSDEGLLKYGQLKAKNGCPKLPPPAWDRAGSLQVVAGLPEMSGETSPIRDPDRSAFSDFVPSSTTSQNVYVERGSVLFSISSEHCAKLQWLMLDKHRDDSTRHMWKFLWSRCVRVCLFLVSKNLIWPAWFHRTTNEEQLSRFWKRVSMSGFCLDHYL